MALLNKIRKDIKKSSYYVWFLGAQESKGLRGSEYITPVVRNLIEREKTVEPFKITLQVSHKGLKIIQNLSTSNAKKPDVKPNKADVIKHVIPHHAVTCVYQDEDVVACVLLLYNPVTRCPVHVHAYRCDTVETATLLTQQLSTLIERPENQRKLNEIEARLRAKGLLLPTVPRVNIPRRLNSNGSDGRSTTSPASESSGSSSGGGQERLTHLYDSLAAELREKLGMNTDSKVPHAPILLPPRDYDTVHRQKGNLSGIDARKCLNENIIGKGKADNYSKEMEKKTRNGRLNRILGSSGGSSGIGSDHPPSPEQTGRYIEAHSISDEEWTQQPSEESLFLVPLSAENLSASSWRQQAAEVSLPRAKSESRPETPEAELPRKNRRSSSREFINEDTSYRPQHHRSQPNLGISIEPYKKNVKGMSPVGVVAPRRRVSEEIDEDSYKKRIPGHSALRRTDDNLEDARWKIIKGKLPDGTMKLSPHERFIDAKTKFLMLEKERMKEQEKNLQNLERRRGHFEAPISPDIVKSRHHWTKESPTEKPSPVPKNTFFDEEIFAPLSSDEITEEDKELFVEKIRKNFSKQELLEIFNAMERQESSKSDDRRKKEDLQSSSDIRGRAISPRQRPSRDYPDDYRREEVSSPPRYSCEDERNWVENKNGIRRRSSNDHYSPPRKPRNTEPESRRRMERRDSEERMRSPTREQRVPYEGRSKVAAAEREKMLHSNALAREFQRRNYHEVANKREFMRRSYAERELDERYNGDEVTRGYFEESDDFRRRGYPEREHNRYPGPDRENQRLPQLPARYRHSYVEQPGLARGHDMIHRTNSSVSNRIGIAALHPY